MRITNLTIVLLLLLLAAPHAPSSAAEFTLDIVDPVGEGFNDPTPVDPVPGNPGTTLGEQRVNAFVAAAESWGQTLASDAVIVVEAEMPELECGSEFVTLGAAGTRKVFRDFPGAPRSGTWYAHPLANSLAGTDLDPETPQIRAVFNSLLDEGCIEGVSWWYGVGVEVPTGTVPFFQVVRHELAHGEGFTTFVDRETGETLNGFDDAYMVFLEDHRNGLTWPQMTDAQRLSSITATGNLHWLGPEARARSSVLTDGVHPSGHLEMYAPDPMEQGSSVSHWTTDMTPDELMEPNFVGGARPRDLVTTGLLADLGWPLVGAGAPDPPPGPWLTSPELPGFEAKVRVTPQGGAAIAGDSEPICIAESLCVSGALAGRPEVFLKVIGPRPNGFLWVQISRFTPSEVEVWVRQIATGEINQYRLAPVGPGDENVSGLQDREAFVP